MDEQNSRHPTDSASADVATQTPVTMPSASWRTSDLIRAAVVAIVVYALARLVFYVHTLLFVTFLGTLFGLALSSGADRLERLRVPRVIGAPLILLSVIGLLVGFASWTGPTLGNQYEQLQQRLPEAVGKIDHWLSAQREGVIGKIISSLVEQPSESRTTADTLTTAAQQQANKAAPPGIGTVPQDSLAYVRSIGHSIRSSMSGAARYVFPVISSTFAAITGLILVLFLSIYIAVDPGLYRRGIISLIPARRRAEWEPIVAASAAALRKWLTTQLVAMLVIGVVTTLALVALQVEAALPLGILAGLLEFVPTIGPTLSAVPAIAMAFIDSPQKAAVVTLAYVGIQFLENHLLIPVLMKEGVDLPPVLTVVTQAVMAVLFGFMGLFVAVPLLVLMSVIVKMAYIDRQRTP